MEEQNNYEFGQRSPCKGFPELHWTGKRPYNSTQYYPAQLKESYGEEQIGWINKIFWGDNLQVMGHMMQDYLGKIDLIYIDPPFDSKADYKKKIDIRGAKASSDITSFEEKQYTDIWTNDEYLQFMYERLHSCQKLLSETGSIYVHMDEKRAHYVRQIMDELFGQNNFRREIIWDITVLSGFKSQAQNWIRGHDVILYYAKNVGQVKYNKLFQKQSNKYLKRFNKVDENGRRYFDGRGERRYLDDVIKKGKPYGDVWGDVLSYQSVKAMLTEIETLDELSDYVAELADDKALYDVWGDIMSFQQIPTSAENRGYPTQKPESLLQRIILSATDPGDLVFDCFMGSGTTQAVAMKLGRRFIGADINLGAIQTTTKRLLSVGEELKRTHKKVTYKMIQSQLSAIAEGSSLHLDADSKEGDDELSAEDLYKVIRLFKEKGIDTSPLEESIKYTGFEVYNVNNYDFFRNPVEARDLLISALEIQPFPQSDLWDGELDGRMVKIMPVNRIATKADLQELVANLPYKTYEKRKGEYPNQPVERITIVCMGHEPDLKGALERELSDYKVDIQIMDILRDKADIQLKRDAEAEIVREGGKLVIRAFYPMNLMQKLSLQKEYVEDWRQLVDSIMIDWNFDGVVMQPAITDVPGKNEMVKGIYDIPEDSGTIKVKITDLLSESLEVEVR